MAPNDEPLKAFRFVVEIDGVARAGFHEVSGLGSRVEVIEHREGGDHVIRKLPGLTRWSNLVLRRGVTRDADLWAWHRTAIEGTADRRSGAIVLLADDGTPAVRWTFRRGWICAWEGPELDAEGDDVAIETIEIAHEGLERE